MSRWSFVKQPKEITFEDFMSFAQQFCDAIDSCYTSPSKVTVKLFEQLPHSITTIQPKLNEWLTGKNKQKQLTEVEGLENVTQALFDQATNVQLDIRPIDDSRAPLSTFGHLECKGLLNHHLVYYVQPEEVGEPVKILHLGQKRPSKLQFSVSDGYEHCHSVSLS